eukprot:2837901-Pyramimonas_sp.AAC.1
MGNVWRFAHQQKDTSETFQRAWEVTQELEVEDGDGEKGKGKRAAGSQAGKRTTKVPRTEPPSSEKKDVSAANKAIENTNQWSCLFLRGPWS